MGSMCLKSCTHTPNLSEMLRISSCSCKVIITMKQESSRETLPNWAKRNSLYENDSENEVDFKRLVQHL